MDFEAFVQTSEDQLVYLQEVGEVKEVGAETVGDVENTHYSFVTDFEKLAANGPEELRESFATLVDEFGVTRSQGEVWIEDLEGQTKTKA